MAQLQVGVDVGGTFTDVVVEGVPGQPLVAAKALSTPAAPVEGVLEGVRYALDGSGGGLEDIAVVRHGTTIATNSVLERRGPRTALLVTKGFRDVLYVGRQARPSLYNLRARYPEPLVPRHLTFEVDERTAWSGDVERPVKPTEIRRLAERLRAEKVGAVAVCFLHSYVNGANEATTREILRRTLPKAAVCLSSEISPQIGEYERASTTSVNAFVMPAVANYVQGLRRELEAFGPGCQIYIMQSNGGAMGPEVAASRSVHTMFSGPAGGVIGARHFAGLAGLSNAITLDVGGTSADVAVMIDGEFQEARDGRIAGLPIRVPLLEINSVGAGGGSIAWVDSGGALRVGPQSAGAVPGPMCYGRKGEAPTLTDAHVVLGYIGADTRLGGRVALDAEAAAVGIRRKIAEPLGLTVERAAAGVVEVANATMVRAIRVLTVERGHDPKDFVLVPFGGAGPLQAVALAQALGIRTIAVPPYAGVLSAVGMLAANIRHDFVYTRIAAVGELTGEGVGKGFQEIEEEALEVMRREGFSRDLVTLGRWVGMRYVGQGFDLRIPVTGRPTLEQPQSALLAAFLEAHRRRYGFATDEPVETVQFGVTAIAALREFRFAGPPPASTPLAAAQVGERPAWFAGQWRTTPVFRRERLPVARLVGPAVIEGEDSTTLLPPGSAADVEPSGVVLIRPEGEEGW